jgi:hypothetical protein
MAEITGIKPPGPKILYGKDRPTIPLDERLRGGQGHTRTFADVEKTIAEYGTTFSFAEELKRLATVFPDAPKLSLLDGGCGEGVMLSEIKPLQGFIGKPVETTGVTMEQEQADILAKKDIDSVFIGSVQEYYNQIKDQQKFHFILDSSGAVYHDFGDDTERGMTEGETIIPIYADLLVPRGRAFMSFLYLHPLWGESPRRNILTTIANNNLDVISEMGNHGYLLVEKRSEQ